MKESLEDIGVVVKGNSDNTVTITRDIRPTHNSARVIRMPEVVVAYFSDEELAHLRSIHISPSISPKEDLKGKWEKYVSYVVHKTKK